MHAHISVSGLPACPEKKKKIPSDKNFPVSGLPIEQFCTSRGKKKFSMELKSMKLEFHWEKQSKIEQSISLNRALSSFDLEN